MIERQLTAELVGQDGTHHGWAKVPDPAPQLVLFPGPCTAGLWELVPDPIDLAAGCAVRYVPLGDAPAEPLAAVVSPTMVGERTSPVRWWRRLLRRWP